MRIHLPGAVILALTLGLLGPAIATAMPPIPMKIIGSVTVNGVSPPDGTSITAYCAGQVIGRATTSAYAGGQHFSLNALGDDSDSVGLEGCQEGQQVSFVVGSLSANEMIPWQSGSIPYRWQSPLSITARQTAAPSARKTDDGLVLSWLHTSSDIVHYEVYRSQNPYFTPNEMNFAPLEGNITPPSTGPVTFTDPAALNPPASGYYYVIRAIRANGASYWVSGRSGIFTFALQPGSH